MYGYTPQAGDVVFDVGAGFGGETLLFSRLVGPEGRVVSIEAHPETFRWLAKLCDLNKLRNVTLLQIAASDQEGSLQITETADLLASTVLDLTADGIRVQGRRLDQVAHELGIPAIDLLKVNIEGAEVAALSGIESVIGSVRHVCIGCHDFRADNGDPETMRTKAQVSAFLRGHGFSLTTQDSPVPWVKDYVYGTSRSNAQPHGTPDPHS